MNPLSKQLARNLGKHRSLSSIWCSQSGHDMGGRKPTTVFRSSQLPCSPVNPLQQRFLSSYSPVEWWRGRQEAKEAEKYTKRVTEMAEKAFFTVGDMSDELGEAVSSWAAKIPGLNNNKEINQAKAMHKTINGLMEITGRDATVDTLSELSRAEKLKAAVAAETSVEEINVVIQQFEGMSLMHRVLRKRKEEGRPIPKTADSMQAVIQTEGPKLLTKAQKSRMMKNQERNIKKASRRR